MCEKNKEKMKKKKNENLPATYRKELLNKFVKIDFIFFGSFMLRLVELFLLNSYCPEAATRGVLCKKLFLEISQNSQENTCARVSFLIKLQALGRRPAMLLKGDSGTGGFL